MLITHVLDTLTQVKGVIVQDKGENLWISSTYRTVPPTVHKSLLIVYQLSPIVMKLTAKGPALA